MKDGEIITEVLDALETDEQASLVASAVRANWTGDRFDAEALQTALSALQPPERDQP